MSFFSAPFSGVFVLVRPRFCSPRWLWMGLSITASVNTVIALALWLAGLGGLDQQMVYSQAIGLSIWALTNAGAVLCSRPTDAGGFPTGWRVVLLVPGCTLTGVFIGTAVGDAYAGRTMLSWGEHNPHTLMWLFAMSVTVGLVMTAYFYLLGKGRYLQTELERSQRQSAQAHLKLLQSQLEPHMLFNTLANLRVLIALDPDRAQTMLDHLIAFLRSTLHASRASEHPLSTEFERLHDYLALMSIRMGPRLTHTLDLPSDLRAVPVPPLLLQPLVENAIRHGLEPQVQGGHLQVSARTEQTPNGTLLVVDITDTGAGWPDNHTQGFGLLQVRERLHTTYGPSATLTHLPQQPRGTCMRVSLPLPLPR